MALDGRASSRARLLNTYEAGMTSSATKTPISVEMGVFVALLVIPASYVFSRRALDDALPSSAIAVLATLYVGMLGGSLIRLRNDFTDLQRTGPKLVFFLVLVVWLGDAG